jgi:hypothetical protein
MDLLFALLLPMTTILDEEGKLSIADAPFARSFDSLGSTDGFGVTAYDERGNNHLFNGINTCKVYVQAYANDFSGSSFRAKVYTITINANGQVVTPTNATPVVMSNAGLMLVDATTYGHGYAVGQQLGQSRYIVTQDRLREFGTNRISIQLDDDGNFNPNTFITNLSLGLATMPCKRT